MSMREKSRKNKRGKGNTHVYCRKKYEISIEDLTVSEVRRKAALEG